MSSRMLLVLLVGRSLCMPLNAADPIPACATDRADTPDRARKFACHEPTALLADEAGETTADETDETTLLAVRLRLGQEKLKVDNKDEEATTPPDKSLESTIVPFSAPLAPRPLPSFPDAEINDAAEEYILIGSNMHCNDDSPDKYLGPCRSSMNIYVGISLATCQRSCDETEGCKYISWVASAGYGNMYKVCETTPHGGRDVYRSGAETPATTPAPQAATMPSCFFGKHVLITSQWSNHNLQDRRGNLRSHANAGDWEKWTIHDAGTGKVFIRSHRDVNLQDSRGNLRLDANTGAWEKWTIHDAGHGKVFIRSHRDANLRDTTVEPSGSFRVFLSAKTGAKEKWTICGTNGTCVTQADTSGPCSQAS